MLKQVLFSTILFLLPTEDYQAKVIGVTDGDTIVVLDNNNIHIKVRLEGIDCPESHQEFGDRAKQATVALCFGRTVRIEKTGVDRYGRTLAFVYVGDICVNKELLRQGMAWHYKQYNKDPGLAKLEIDAKEKRICLWSQPNPVPPWEWRKSH